MGRLVLAAMVVALVASCGAVMYRPADSSIRVVSLKTPPDTPTLPYAP
jgi:hypothetical protein